MQQEVVSQDSVATTDSQNDHAEARGPVVLQPEMLRWISGGATSSEELPRGTW